MKTCSDCKQSLPESEFYDCQMWHWASARCKVCHSENRYRKLHPQPCPKCQRHRKLDSNGACKACNREEMLKQCFKCLQVLPTLLSFDKGCSYCKECERVRKKWKNIKDHYGINRVQYEEMLDAQDGVCAICELPPSNKKGFHIDHDHKTNVIRGLLCHQCNHVIGQAKDRVEVLQAAVEYLIKPRNPNFKCKPLSPSWRKMYKLDQPES